MKINTLWIGKTRKKELASLIDDFKKRIIPLSSFEIIEIHEEKNYSKLPHKEALKREAKKIIDKVGKKGAYVVLNDKGTLYTSRELARSISNWAVSHREMTFIIGSHYGIAPSIKQKALASLSLSRMTFTHEMSRVILIEQIYRALTIIKKIPYHK